MSSVDTPLTVLYRLAGVTEADIHSSHPITLTKYLDSQNGNEPQKFGIRRKETFAGLGEKGHARSNNSDSQIYDVGSRQSLRNLSLTQTTFRKICERFQIHQSIVRAITRSDVPSFSCEKVHMEQPAIGKRISVDDDRTVY